MQKSETIIKITKMSIWKFWSRDGVKKLDFLIGRHFILFLPRNSSKTVKAIPTGHGDSVYFSNPACLSVGLVRTCYGLSLMGLGLVLVVSRLVRYKISRPQGSLASRSRQAWMYHILYGR